jgi:PEP-CTERM motif
MMRTIQMAMACVAVLIATTGQVQAALLYSAPPVGNTFTGWDSNSGQKQQIVQEFSLGTGGTVDTISFFGFHDSGTPSIGSTFVLEFFADIAGSPAANPFYSHTTAVVAGVDTGINTFNNKDIFRWDFSVPGVGLSAMTQYWFGVKSNSADRWVWSHSASDGSGSLWFRFDDASAFEEFGGNIGRDNQAMEFATSAAAVPEPTSLAIFGIGACVAGLGAARRRRREKQ